VLTLGALLCLAGALLAMWPVREREIERQPIELEGEHEPETVPDAAAA
jgi:hypothetical protein